MENFTCEDRQGSAYGNAFIPLMAARKIFFLFLRDPCAICTCVTHDLVTKVGYKVGE